MTSGHDGRLGFVAGAARGAASFPARAAANVCRDRLEDAAEAVLAGPLPEEIVRSAVRHRVLQRMASELATDGALDALLSEALDGREAQAVVDRIVGSEAMQRALRDIMTSPEVRDALLDQTAGFSEEVVTALRARAAALDGRADRRRAVTPGPYAGIASRALAFAADAGICAALFLAVGGVATVAGWMVGGLRPEWLAGLLLTTGFAALSGCYFVLFWSTAGRTPGMHLLHISVAVAGSTGPLSIPRSVVRLAGLALAIVPLFGGFLPVLFDRRRRGIADMLAGTAVVYGWSPAGAAPTAAVPATAPSSR
jgi:uncharacterized RDD family membrane protein YckC